MDMHFQRRGHSGRSIGCGVVFLVMMSVLSFGSAPNVYVAQGTLGAANGLDCANAYATNFFNTIANWGPGPTQIGPGTTVHLCGTIAAAVNKTILTFHGSGVSGSPITLFWEPGSVVTSPACSSCIDTSGNSFLVFDGNGTKPSITDTANGSGLANSQNSVGINASQCNNCELKNMTIANMYQHTSSTDTACGCGTGIFLSGSNYLIHDNWFDQMFNEIDDPYQDGDHDIQIFNNTFNHFNWGVHIGNNAPTALNNVFIHDNHLMDSVNWDTANDAYHHDGLFVVQNNTSAMVSNVFFYNNLADGIMSACIPNSCATAWIYFNTGMHGIYVFNNILKASGGYLVEGGYPGDTNFLLYNNYLDCNGGGGIYFSSVSGFTVENNAMNNCYTFVIGNNVTNALVDHNLYAVSFNLGSAFKWNNPGGATFAQYQAANPTFDVHSLTPTAIAATSTGYPLSGSPIIHDNTIHFANLSSSCTGALSVLCTDKVGALRPTTGNWDAGAYTYAISTKLPVPPIGLVASVQ